MRKKLNQNLLSEELKKFKLLSEYTFYTEKENNDNGLILGSPLDEEGPENAEDKPDDSKTSGTPDANAAPDPNAAPAGDDNLFDTGDSPEASPADPAAADASMGVPPAPEVAPAPAPAPPSDEVDIDVTQLVKGSEEATQAASDASQKTSELLSKFNDLERRVAAMGSITNKIETLEKEIIKRNPTPVEKLEMRSMDSFPYNIKLNDYWKDVEGYEPESKNNELVLTKDDVDAGFTDSSVKKSFQVPDDYEEEDY